MILTLTANAALDRVIFIDEFRPETTMRAPRSVSYTHLTLPTSDLV